MDKSRRALQAALLLAIVLASAIVVFLVWRTGGTHGPPTNSATPLPQPPSQEDREARLKRGKAVADTAPPLGTPEWQEWHARLNPEDRMAWAAYMDNMGAPPPPTSDQKDAVRVATVAGTPFPAWCLNNYKPLLRMDDGVSITPLMVETVRTPSGWVSTFWARRARDAFRVEWGAGRVTQVKLDNAKEAEGPCAQYLAPESILFDGAKGLTLKLGSRVHYSPWKDNGAVYPLVVVPEAPYAFAQVKRETGVSSIIVVDTANGRLVHTISVPNAPSGVHCIFNGGVGYLYLFDYDWQWVMLFDLRKANE